MKRALVVGGVVILVALVAVVGLPRSHWLVPHGSVTCDGTPVSDARLYRSQDGSFFVLRWRNGGEGMPGVVPRSHDLLRCNTPAFRSVGTFLFSREPEPSSQCTMIWKGAGSNDVIPKHVVTENHAEFPWDTCTKLRINY